MKTENGIICDVCKNPIIRDRIRKRDSTQEIHFCSRKCFSDQKKSNHTCETCGVSFFKNKCHSKRVEKHYCTRECYQKRILDHEKYCIQCKKEIIGKKRWSKTHCSSCKKKERLLNKQDKWYEERKIKRRIKRGLPLDLERIIAKNGEGHISKAGYKILTKHGHPNASKKTGKILEHTFIMSVHLGRPLFKGETVHHINGIRQDNRIENLELWNSQHGGGQRVEDKIKFYIEFLEQYPEFVQECGYKLVKE
jgi:hypothetical protein